MVVSLLVQVVKSGEAVRPAVALALVKLLRLLPPAAIRTALPRALQGVANLLKNRLQRIRCLSHVPLILHAPPASQTSTCATCILSCLTMMHQLILRRGYSQVLMKLEMLVCCINVLSSIGTTY